VQNKILLKYIQKNEIDVPRISGFREGGLRGEDLEFDLSWKFESRGQDWI